jgi:hypothetical protein
MPYTQQQPFQTYDSVYTVSQGSAWPENPPEWYRSLDGHDFPFPPTYSGSMGMALSSNNMQPDAELLSYDEQPHQGPMMPQRHDVFMTQNVPQEAITTQAQSIYPGHCWDYDGVTNHNLSLRCDKNSRMGCFSANARSLSIQPSYTEGMIDQATERLTQPTHQVNQRGSIPSETRFRERKEQVSSRHMSTGKSRASKPRQDPSSEEGNPPQSTKSERSGRAKVYSVRRADNGCFKDSKGKVAKSVEISTVDAVAAFVGCKKRTVLRGLQGVLPGEEGTVHKVWKVQVVHMLND